MSNSERPKLFGKIRLGQIALLLIGSQVFSNFAMLLTRNPNLVVILGYSAMIVGAFVTRFCNVKAVGYIIDNFDENPRRAAVIKIYYTAFSILLIALWFFSKSALEQHVL